MQQRTIKVGQMTNRILILINGDCYRTAVCPAKNNILLIKARGYASYYFMQGKISNIQSFFL